MKRTLIILCMMAAAGVGLRFFPLFHVVPIEKVRAEKQQAAFDAAAFATEFWNGRLLPSLDQAADASAVLAAIQANPQEARNEFGRSSGLGRTCYYFVRGSGTVVSVAPKEIGVSLRGEGGEPDVVLPAGLLFGNTARDTTGLLEPSDFPNSQHFNAISTELNRIIESQVIPHLKEQAEVGRKIQFTGCAEVLGERISVQPLKVIPVEVKFE